MALAFSSGGGGTATGHGALAELTNDTAFSNGATLVCDNELFDTDGYYNPATGLFTIPAGKAGLYYVVCYAESGTIGLTGLNLTVHTAAASANVVFPGSQDITGTFDLSGSTLMELAATNSLHFTVGDQGADPVTLVGGQTGIGIAFFGAA